MSGPKGLNPQQQRAVETTEGPVLIIAGPGSGKTFVLVERIFHLITDKGIRPENLFIATFTEKAAQELITRISNRLYDNGVNINLNEMYIGTLHSIFLRILQENQELTRLKRNFTVMDQFDQQYFLYRRMDEFDSILNGELILGNSETTPRWRRAASLVKWVNKVSEDALDVGVLLRSSDLRVNALGSCYTKYNELLELENALDFSTIQVEMLRLLKEQPTVLNSLQNMIQYIMVDEYQDTNTIQEAILLLLTGGRKNICVVGDDDQGLYRFRGATIQNILEFPSHFEPGECQQIKLVINYRSKSDIIRFYNQWMNHNDWEHEGLSFRFDKNITPTDQNISELTSVVKVSGDDGQDNWHDEVYSFLQQLKSFGVLEDWNQVAFLFRSVKNDRAVQLARSLEEKGIPIYSPRSNMFFEREEIRLLLGAIIFLFPQFPNIRQWNENVHLNVWDYLDGCFGDFAKQLRLPGNKGLWDWCRKKAKSHLTLGQNADYAFSGLFYQLLQFPLFSKFLDGATSNGVMDSRAARNLAIFSKLIVKFEYLHNISVLTPDYLERNIQDLFNNYFRFLLDGGINEYEDISEYAPSGCVSFLTIHQSKGLEFPVVFVGSLEAVPTKQYTDLDEVLQQYYRKPMYEPLERIKFYDFWRLYYTAFSRAQNLLVLTCQEHTPHAKGERRTPSKYFAPVYGDVPSWREVRDLEMLTLQKIKDVNLKHEYSFTSHITLFENCARQYLFFKELEFAPVRQSAMLFGTLVHQTIEDVHKCALSGDTHLITSDQITEWFNKNYRYLVKKERVYLAPQTQAVLIKQVLNYVHRHEGNWSLIKEAEVDVSLVKEQYILKGKVDLIRGSNDTVEIVDFKSEKKPDLFREQDKLERYRRQLEVYAHIVEERTGEKVSKLHLYYTGENDGNPYVTFNKDQKSVNRTVETFDKIVDRIEKKDFTIKERPAKLCLNCDIRFYCDAK